MSSLQQVWKDRYLSLPTKIRVYEMLVLPVLLYACETWTILAADERRLEAFHMKCQRQITKIRWQDHIRNSEVAARTCLGPVSDLITCCRNSVFGHIARLSEDTPAHQPLRCHVDLTLGHLPDQSWKRRPGHPNNRWIDQLRRDNNNTPVMPPADLWKIHHTWSFGSDATVLDDYALTTSSVQKCLILSACQRQRLCRDSSNISSYI